MRVRVSTETEAEFMFTIRFVRQFSIHQNVKGESMAEKLETPATRAKKKLRCGWTSSECSLSRWTRNRRIKIKFSTYARAQAKQEKKSIKTLLYENNRKTATKYFRLHHPSQATGCCVHKQRTRRGEISQIDLLPKRSQEYQLSGKCREQSESGKLFPRFGSKS